MEIKLNYQEDFKVLITLPEGVGTSPFKVVLHSGGARYVAMFDGISYTNCSRVDDAHVMVAVDKHRLAPGELEAEILLLTPDSMSPTLTTRLATRSRVTALKDGEEGYIALVDGKTDRFDSSEMLAELLAPVISSGNVQLASDILERVGVLEADMRNLAGAAYKMTKQVVANIGSASSLAIEGLALKAGEVVNFLLKDEQQVFKQEQSYSLAYYNGGSGVYLTGLAPNELKSKALPEDVKKLSLYIAPENVLKTGSAVLEITVNSSSSELDSLKNRVSSVENNISDLPDIRGGISAVSDKVAELVGGGTKKESVMNCTPGTNASTYIDINLRNGDSFTVTLHDPSGCLIEGQGYTLSYYVDGVNTYLNGVVPNVPKVITLKNDTTRIATNAGGSEILKSGQCRFVIETESSGGMLQGIERDIKDVKDEVANLSDAVSACEDKVNSLAGGDEVRSSVSSYSSEQNLSCSITGLNLQQGDTVTFAVDAPSGGISDAVTIGCWKDTGENVYLNNVAVNGTKEMTLKFNVVRLDFSCSRSSITKSGTAVCSVTKTVTGKLEQIEERLDALEGGDPYRYQGHEVTLFNKVLFIGDSTIAGVFDTKRADGSTDYSWSNQIYSAPSQFTKLTGVESVNMGRGGYTAQQWYDAFKDDARIVGVDCAVIQLGINDTNYTTVSATKSALRQIIAKLKEKNARITIFINTIVQAYRGDKFNTWSAGIREVAAEYSADDGVYLMDLNRDSHIGEDATNWPYNQGHFTALGYLRQAMEYVSFMSYTIANNSTKFMNVQFSNTDKHLLD